MDPLYFHAQLSGDKATFVLMKTKANAYESLMTLAKAKIIEGNFVIYLDDIRDRAYKDISNWDKFVDLVAGWLSCFGIQTTAQKIDNAYNEILRNLPKHDEKHSAQKNDDSDEPGLNNQKAKEEDKSRRDAEEKAQQEEAKALADLAARIRLEKEKERELKQKAKEEEAKLEQVTREADETNAMNKEDGASQKIFTQQDKIKKREEMRQRDDRRCALEHEATKTFSNRFNPEADMKETALYLDKNERVEDLDFYLSEISKSSLDQVCHYLLDYSSSLTRARKYAGFIRNNIDATYLTYGLYTYDESLEYIGNFRETKNVLALLEQKEFDKAYEYAESFCFKVTLKIFKCVIDHQAARYYIETQKWDLAQRHIDSLKFKDVQKPYLDELKKKKEEAAPYLDPLYALQKAGKWVELLQAVIALPSIYQDTGYELLASSKNCLIESRNNALKIVDETRKEWVIEENLLYSVRDVNGFTFQRKQELSDLVNQKKFDEALLLVGELTPTLYSKEFSHGKLQALRQAVMFRAACHFAKSRDYKKAEELAAQIKFGDLKSVIDSAIQIYKVKSIRKLIKSGNLDEAEKEVIALPKGLIDEGYARLAVIDDFEKASRYASIIQDKRLKEQVIYQNGLYTLEQIEDRFKALKNWDTFKNAMARHDYDMAIALTEKVIDQVELTDAYKAMAKRYICEKAVEYYKSQNLNDEAEKYIKQIRFADIQERLRK